MLPDTLRLRLAAWFAAVVGVLLVGYSAVVYVFAVVEPDEAELFGSVVDEAEAAQRGLLFALLATLPVALLAGVGGALWITRRGLRPLDDVVDVADGLGLDRLDVRVDVQPSDPAELRRLGTSMNAMLERLERSVGSLQRFTADASHELRTPLARLITGMETTLRHPRDEQALRTALEEALEDARTVARLADALLALSRADAGEAIAIGSCDVAAVVDDVRDAYEGEFAAAGVAFVVDVDAGAGRVVGDPLWITRALSNLVENARKFTPSGGRVRVVVGVDGEHVVVAVEDSGPGIDAALRERVFERFFRATAVRGSVDGFGLGLPLARDIARSCGGDVVVDGAFVGGARVVLRLARPRDETR